MSRDIVLNATVLGTLYNKYINLCRISDLENDIIHFNTDISLCFCSSHFECILYNSVVHTLWLMCRSRFEMQMNECKCFIYIYIRFFDATLYALMYLF